MTEFRKVIPGHQVVGYILAACLVLVPLLAYQDAVDLFGSPAVLNLAFLTGGGGAASAFALAARGDRLLALLPGLVGGICVAFGWDALLHSSFGASFASGKLKPTAALGIGAAPGLALFWLLKLVRKLTSSK